MRVFLELGWFFKERKKQYAIGIFMLLIVAFLGVLPPRIIGFVAQTVVALIDWDLPMQAAIDLPRAVNMNGSTQLEAGTALESASPALVLLGHEVEVRELVSGLHGIRITEDGLDGGADRRREGAVIAVEP